MFFRTSLPASLCFAAAALSAAALVGCGPPSADYSKVDLVPVSGTVTLDGQPLAQAVITFENPDNGMFAYALTNASGGYELQFDSVKKGCTPGSKIVRISTTRSIPGLTPEAGEVGDGEGGEEEDGGEAGAAPARRQERVPAVYNRESTLQVEVSSGSRTHDFDLTSG